MCAVTTFRSAPASLAGLKARNGTLCASHGGPIRSSPPGPPERSVDVGRICVGGWGVSRRRSNVAALSAH
jgi:hypothetical protein